ncbi:MAG: asparagine synthase (glutamine-hydrolyzing) [Ktedonobacteraceae bacterium]
MCGITGWIDWQADLSNQSAILENMSGCLSRRGPDEQGHWLSPRAALAHRRLIVLDPQGGKQPMLYEAGSHTYVITYNGEIYNFRELRSELETHGHTFRTHSDTEVLLHAYIEWGEDCVHRLNGIFAFGLWDEQKQQLLLARDHLGVKPLFYAQRGSSILFASEIKALLAHPLVKPEVGADGLAEVFSFGRLTPGFGVFNNMHEVRAGHMLVFNRERARTIQYWSLHSAPHTDDLDTTVEHIRALLEDTVRRQLVADVPVAAMLSGGLDSSGLTALAAREFQRAGKQLHTYSIDFVDSAQHFQGTALRPNLDAPWVQRVSEHVGTQHHTLMIDTPELVENMLVPLHAHDLPSMGQMETSLYLLFKTMKQDATVAISGESADEVFGGYPWFHDQATLNVPTFPWMAMMGAGSGNQFSWLSAEMREKIRPSEYIERRYQEALAEVPRLAGEDAHSARIREILYMNQTRFLSLLLNRKDRMSMATGFEVRVPFCDHRLVEYVWNIPWEMKNVDNIEKGVLRRAFAGVLPDDARMRRKSAYPASHNPTYVQAIQDWALRIINDPNAPVRSVVDIPVVQAMASGTLPALPGVPSDFAVMFLERIIQVNAWFQDYKISVC